MCWPVPARCRNRRPAGFCRGGCRSPRKRPSESRRWRMPWLVTANRRYSTPTRARSSPARPSPACSPATASPSAWTARARGATTCSSSGCGAASNTRMCTCGPTKASARHATRSADTSISTMAVDHIRALTTPHRIKPTSTCHQSAWRPNLGRRSTYRGGNSVQTTETNSLASSEAAAGKVSQ